MANANFHHDFGSIKVHITGPFNDATVSVEGTKEFVNGINWERAYDSAKLFAAHTDSPFMAVALAIQMQYAAWDGFRHTLNTLKV